MLRIKGDHESWWRAARAGIEGSVTGSRLQAEGYGCRGVGDIWEHFREFVPEDLRRCHSPRREKERDHSQGTEHRE